MKRFLVLAALMLLCSLTFVQCKRCHDKFIGELDFTPTDLNIVPYNGAVKLIFKDSLGDSIIYQGTGRHSDIINPYHETYHDDPCFGDYYTYEQNYTDFYSNGSDGEIRIYLTRYFKTAFSSPEGKSFDLSISYNKSGSYFFNSSFYFDDLKLSEFRDNTIMAINDTLQLGPKTFYSVYTLDDGYTNLNIAYYSVSEGLVGFKSNDGHLWYLAN